VTSSVMKTLRSDRSTYIAAFLLGALIALMLNWPARAAVGRAMASAIAHTRS
jgi:hypothetical protein